MTEQIAIETMVCGKTFTLAEARALYPKLLIALLEGKSVIFDGEKIEQVDAAAMQLCCAFMSTQSVYQQQIQWRKPSAALVNTARLLGLADAMGLNTSHHGPSEA